jgi:membrane fusion protein, multidrug efflux system
MSKRFVLILALLLPVAAALYHFWPGWSAAPSAHGAGGEARPQPVLAADVVARPMPVQLDTIGRVQPIASVAVKARIDGQIAEVAAADGQEVKVGDLLFVLDSRQAKAELDQAAAMLQRDQAQLANAQRELDRLTPLGQKEFASKQQLDAARTAVAAAQATVSADQAVVDNDKVQLSYTVIRAPIDGRLGTIGQKLGSTIKAADATPLVMINQMRPIYVAFSLPERHLAELQEAMAAGPMAVAATLPGEHGTPQQGTVAYIENATDPATGTLSVKAGFANAQERLWPGQFVNVAVTLRIEPNAIVVPSEAVQASQDGPLAFVVKPDDTVEPRAVTVDRTVGTETVIATGLAAGERVVTVGQMRLTPGAKVAVQEQHPPDQGDHTS